MNTEGAGTDSQTRIAQTIEQKRALLFSARLRFSPEAQSIREAAIEGVIEQVLLLAGSASRFSLPDLEAHLRQEVGENPALSLSDVRAALTRLSQRGRVTGEGTGFQTRTYQLTDNARQEIEAEAQVAQSTYDRVVQRLFANSPGGAGRYSRAFLECLQVVFMNVAETYVRLITGDLDEGEIVSQTAIESALEVASAEHAAVPSNELERALTSFLLETNPDYDGIKWNMTQNYYVVKALGWDTEGYLLSKQIFAGAILYLDTNVVFPALEPQSRHYRNFEAVSRACRQLGIELRVTQLTLSELRGVVAFNRNMIAKVEEQIPEDLADRVNSVFYQAYLEAKANDPQVSLDAVFASFDSAANTLADTHAVELIDDLWFDDHKSSSQAAELAASIQREYTARRPERIKSASAALHDALLLMWVEWERKREERPVWLVTLDTSLPAFVPDPGQEDRRPLAITLDALLQWIWPFASSADGEGGLNEVFAEALRLHLLPRERFLDLRDFEVLADFHLSCKELPAQDVEECIRLIQRKAPGLNLKTPEGREKLAYELARFFAAPDRRYKREVQRLEAILREREGELDEMDRKRRGDLERLRRTMEERMSAVQEEMELRQNAIERDLARRDATIAELQGSLDRAKANNRQVELRSSARARLVFALLVWAVLEALVIWLNLRFGSGQNALQKLQSATPWMAGALAVCLLFALLILGKERLMALGWRTRQLLRGSTDA